MEIGSIITELGLSNADLLQNLGKITGFLPKIKGYLPKIEEWEKTLALRPGQKVIYSLSCAPKAGEIFVHVFVVERKTFELKDGTMETHTVIVEEKYHFKGFEELDKMVSLIPKI